MNIVREDFNSIDEFLKSINTRKNNSIFENKNHSKTNDKSFTGTENYEEAEQLIKYGWEEPLKELKIANAIPNVSSYSSRRIPKNSIIGYAPCVPNAIRGIPESMINTQTIVQKTKTITIVFSNTANCMIGTNEFIKCGTTVIQLINSLESKGIRVKLLSNFYCAECGNEYAFGNVTIKDFKDKLDLKKLAFPIAHTSFFRRFGFKWIETCSGLTNNSWSDGYGKSMMEGYHVDIIKKNFIKENEVFINQRIIKSANYNVDELIKNLNLK